MNVKFCKCKSSLLFELESDLLDGPGIFCEVAEHRGRQAVRVLLIQIVVEALKFIKFSNMLQ